MNKILPYIVAGLMAFTIAGVADTAAAGGMHVMPVSTSNSLPKSIRFVH